MHDTERTRRCQQRWVPLHFYPASFKSRFHYLLLSDCEVCELDLCEFFFVTLLVFCVVYTLFCSVVCGVLFCFLSQVLSALTSGFDSGGAWFCMISLFFFVCSKWYLMNISGKDTSAGFLQTISKILIHNRSLHKVPSLHKLSKAFTCRVHLKVLKSPQIFEGRKKSKSVSTCHLVFKPLQFYEEFVELWRLIMSSYNVWKSHDDTVFTSIHISIFQSTVIPSLHKSTRVLTSFNLFKSWSLHKFFKSHKKSKWFATCLNNYFLDSQSTQSTHTFQLPTKIWKFPWII